MKGLQVDGYKSTNSNEIAPLSSIKDMERGRKGGHCKLQDCTVFPGRAPSFSRRKSKNEQFSR